VSDKIYKFIDGDSWEKRTIKELNIKPVYATHFMNFIRRFTAIYNIDQNAYVAGEYDHKAGSMHLHISFEEINNVDFVVGNSNWVTALACVFFGKEHYNFRDIAFGNSEGTVRSALGTPYDYLCDAGSKHFALTKNKVNSTQTTAEWRINENTLPLWVYWVPVLTLNDYLFKDIAKELLDLYRSTDNWLHQKETAVLTKQAAKIAKGLYPFVEKYWRTQNISNITAFKKIMKVYVKNDFCVEETVKVIDDILAKDKIWQADYV